MCFFYLRFKKEMSYIYSNGTGNITNSLRKNIPANLVPTEKTQLLQEADTEDEEKKRELPSLYKVLAKVYYLPLFKAQLVGLIGDLTVFINPLLLE